MNHEKKKYKAIARLFSFFFFRRRCSFPVSSFFALEIGYFASSFPSIFTHLLRCSEKLSFCVCFPFQCLVNLPQKSQKKSELHISKTACVRRCDREDLSRFWRCFSCQVSFFIFTFIDVLRHHDLDMCLSHLHVPTQRCPPTPFYI